MQVDDDGKPRYDELVFPADGRGYFVIDTVPSLQSTNEAKTETGARLEIRILITALLRQFMEEARSWAESVPLVPAEDPNKRRFESDVCLSPPKWSDEESMGESEPEKQTQNAGSPSAASAADYRGLDETGNGPDHASSLPAAGDAPYPTVRGATPKSKAKVFLQVQSR
jgi:hypothetical protein